MKLFNCENFLLSTETAKTLYHDHAKKMPIIDYHCHVNPREIAEDLHYQTITQAWLSGDHYKWRAMRINGIEEKYITGDASDYEKFQKWAEIMPLMIGNPIYHWTHLELKTYFGITEPLSADSCDRIWNACNKTLQTLSVREIIRRSRVTAICTTDDPADSLEYHKQLQKEEGFDTLVLPAFRPDKALGIDKPGFAQYIPILGKAWGKEIGDLASLKNALTDRAAFFASMGCVACDHGVDYPPFVIKSEQEVDGIFKKVLAGQTLTAEEADAYKTNLLIFLTELYVKHNFIMEFHFGVIRNNNAKQFSLLGPDTGYDAIGGFPCGKNLAQLLDAFNSNGSLPKMIVYSLNPIDNATISSILGCFASSDAPGKIQQGSSWWFNDTKTGMQEQLISFANLSTLSRFVGMLTDSRSFLSYTRHDYFRRILCELIGGWVENGEYPLDRKVLGKMVEDISYNNTKEFFGLRI